MNSDVTISAHPPATFTARELFVIFLEKSVERPKRRKNSKTQQFVPREELEEIQFYSSEGHGIGNAVIEMLMRSESPEWDWDMAAHEVHYLANVLRDISTAFDRYRKEFLIVEEGKANHASHLYTGPADASAVLEERAKREAQKALDAVEHREKLLSAFAALKANASTLDDEAMLESQTDIA